MPLLWAGTGPLQGTWLGKRSARRMTAPLASWAGCPCVGHSMHNLLRGPGEDFPFSPKLQICLFLLIRSDFASHSNQQRITLILCSCIYMCFPFESH